MGSYALDRIGTDIETDVEINGVVEKYNLDLIEIKEGCKFYNDKKYNFIIKYDIINEEYILNDYIGESENVIIPPYVKSCNTPFKKCTLNRLEVNGEKSNLKSLCSMFQEFKGREIELINFNTSNIDDMERMFYNCQSLTNLNLGDEFDTCRVHYMTSMFSACDSLTSLNLGNKFDTSRVWKMDTMFENCKSLTSLNLEDNFDTSNVGDMRGMFFGCSSLVSINLGSNFSMNEVRDTSNMFGWCWALTDVYLDCYPSRYILERVLQMNDISLNVLK